MKLHQNLTILLVEDNPDDVFIMRRAIKQAEIVNPLQIVEDGQKAIDYMDGVGPFADRTNFPLPGLIFLDLKLPYKNGFEVLQWISDHSHLKTTIVIVLTSSGEKRDIEQTYRLGGRSFLVKPPTHQMLVEIMTSFKDYWIDHNEYA